MKIQSAGTPQKLFVEGGVSRAEVHVNTIVGDSDNAPLEVTLNWTTGLTK